MKPDLLESNLAKPICYLFLVVGLLCFPIEPVDAHRVNLFAWVEGDTVHVESKFSSGRYVNAGKIIVTDQQGTELLTGTTNEKGKFSFTVPRKTELKIVLMAGAGHRAEWTIAASEIKIPSDAKKPIAEKAPTVRGIIIGIGCILSLTGIAAYIRKHQKKKLDPEGTKI